MAFGSLGAVSYDVVAKDETQKGLDSAEARAKKMNRSALVVGAGMTAVGVGAKLMADNINAAYLTFDTAMAEVKSLGGVTTEQMETMREAAIDISKELPISASNVASGFYMMRSAGFDAGRVIAELPAIAEMAVAGNLEMADAVNSVTMVLDTYGERAGSAADITNVLMGTVQGFKTTLPELQLQLSKNIGVAASLGIEFGELAAMSGMLKKEFVSAEEAGTAMKTMLLRLTDPKVAADMEAMGVQVKDNNGDFIGMQVILDGLATKLDEAGGEVEQMALLQQLFGTEGLRAAMSLIRQKEALIEFSAQVNAGVSVQEALNAVLESTQSQLTIAENKMEAAKIQLGEGMAPATIFAANTMAVFAGVIEGMPDLLQEIAGSGIIAAQSFILIGPGLVGVVSAINLLKMAHAGATIAATAHTVAQWALNIAMYACPLAWIVGAIAAVVTVLIILEKKFGIVTAAVRLLSDGIHAIIGFFGNVVDAIRGVVVDTVDLADADERLIRANEELRESEERVEEAVVKAAESAEDLAEASAELAAAQLEVADAAREVDELTEAYEELKGAMDDVADETENLDDLDRNLRSANLDLREAQIRYTKAVKDHGAGSLEAQRAALREETVIDRIEGIKKRQKETTEALTVAKGVAVETEKKYGDKSLSDIKANLDANLAAHEESYAKVEAAEIHKAEVRKTHEYNMEDVEREKLVYGAALNYIEEVTAEKEKILEGEVVATESAMGKIKAAIESGMGGALDYVTGLYDSFVSAGASIIDGIVAGIKSVAGRIGSAVSGAFKEVDPYKPSSDAEKGPFSDMSKSGKSVVETFAKGIESASGTVGSSFAAGVAPGNISGGDTMNIGPNYLSRDYDFLALMKDIETYQSAKRVQRGIRTI